MEHFRPTSVQSVAMLSPAWPPGVNPNGIVAYTANICAGFKALGVQPWIVTYHKDPASSEPDVLLLEQNGSMAENRVRRLMDRIHRRLRPQHAIRRRKAAAILRTLRALIAKSNLKIFEMEESQGVPTYVVPHLGIPAVVRLHGPWFLNGSALGAACDRVYRNRVAIERQGIVAADGISAPSQDVLDQTRGRYGLELPQARVIRNAVVPVPEAQRWRPETCDSDAVLFVGRFDRHKGGDIVLRAFREVLKRRPGSRLIFVGPDRGLQERGRNWNLHQYLEDQIPAPALRKQVDYQGQKRPVEIQTQRRRAAVTIVASRYENCPNTALEAMASGCPLIATHAGGLPEIIQSMHNGLLVAPGDADQLAAGIVQLFEQRELAAKLAAQAWSDVQTRYSPQAVAQQSLDFYAEVRERFEHSPATRRRRSLQN